MRTPTNKKIKAALKRCSIEAIENLSEYMKYTRDYIDSGWLTYNALLDRAEASLDPAEQKSLRDDEDFLRRDILKHYEKLHSVSETILAYTHRHILNEERVNRTTSTQPDEKEKDDEEDAEPRVSLSAVS
jgi:hypothetical protein